MRTLPTTVQEAGSFHLSFTGNKYPIELLKFIDFEMMNYNF